MRRSEKPARAPMVANKRNYLNWTRHTFQDALDSRRVIEERDSDLLIYASPLSLIDYTSIVIMFVFLLFFSVYFWLFASSAPAIVNSIVSVPTTSNNTVNADYVSYTNNGIIRLQYWYNKKTGQWDTTNWWNSANVLTMLADFAIVSPAFKSAATDVFYNTFMRAPGYKLPMVKINTPTKVQTFTWPNIPSRMSAFATIDNTTTDRDFLNDFYDDEGWWALAWIRAYDVTQQKRYLDTATKIFADMVKGYGATCGGIWWNKAHTANVAIANELFLAVAATLSNRASNKDYYTDWALKQWAWIRDSGLINGDLNINDGLDLKTCKNNGGIVWSYNQGVILGGLIELSKALSDRVYLRIATNIARAGISKLSGQDGILHEPCEPDCGGDGNQFKGIFMRNLQLLQEANPVSEFGAFIKMNADSIWSNARSADNSLDLVWSGPFQTATAATQSSALDALVAAAAISNVGNSTSLSTS